ncbi:MAG TPA: RHS repeat-associated core domain-containing protein, partial [Acidimicrobiales bacterium]
MTGAGEGAATEAAPAAPAGPMVLAVTSGAEGENGSFKATPFGVSGDWQVGVGSGEFSWNYDVPLPPSPGGATPEVNLAYSSGAVDGMVTGKNTQAGRAGLGWGDFADSFIERGYNACRDDGPNGPQTGDLCWKNDNASISLNGHSSELVRIPGPDDLWRLKSDPRWKVERLKLNNPPDAEGNQTNGDKDGEYWKVVTPDGTEYWFGLGYNTDAGVSWKTSSTWTTLVVGDDQGEPCYNEAESHLGWCRQAWRWNLDRVVDPNGNVQEFKYKEETNKFTGAGGFEPGYRYDRGGYLSEITYGRRLGNPGFEGLRVTFDSAVRCASLDPGCAEPAQGEQHPEQYPDIPVELLCDHAPCGMGSPTFFSTQRYTAVRTEANQGISTFHPVDKVELKYQFADAGDPATTDDNKLFLTQIQRTGLSSAGAVPLRLPPTTFAPFALNNHFNPPAGQPLMPHNRIGSVTDEFGRQVNITYGQPHPCAPPTSGPNILWDQNTTDCFPQRWAPEGDPNPTFRAFNKYLVTQVEVKDTTGGSTPMVTSYVYGDQIQAGLPNGGWHHDDDPFTRDDLRSWSEWRGYQDTIVVQGSGSTETRTWHRLFRGLNGDVVQNPSPGYRTVTLSSLDGTVTGAVDDNWLAGRSLDEASLRTDGTTESGVVHGYVVQKTADAPDVCTPACPLNDMADASWVAENDTVERRRKPDSGEVFARHRTSTVYDTVDTRFRRPINVVERGWDDQGSNVRCTKTSYVQNPAKVMWDYPSAQTLYNGTACFGTEITRSETAYDGAALGSSTAPTKGNPTGARTKITNSPLVWSTVTTTFDPLGRPLVVTDPLNRQTTTAYSPVASSPTAPVTLPWRVSVTNPAGHVQTTNFVETDINGNPTGPCPVACTFGRQLPISTVDANGNATSDPNDHKTTFIYDALGRVTEARLPTEFGSANPSWRFSYDVDPNRTEVPVIRTEQLQDTNGTGGAPRYLSTWVVYDSLLRERQTHTLSPAVGKVVVTDTIYDDRGLPKQMNMPEAVAGTPGLGLLAAPSGGWANRTIPSYDAVGRVTKEDFWIGTASLPDRTTTTAYTHNSVEVTPPAGGTKTKTVTDAYGRTGSVQEFDGTAWRSTDYTYDLADRLLTVTDPAANKITYTYDMAARRSTMKDPDAGSWSYGYDLVGNQTRVTDAASAQVHTVYDNLNRPIERHKDSPTGQMLATWTYDQVAKGFLNKSTRVTPAGNWDVAVSGFDNRYRPTQKTWTVPAGVTGLTGSYSVLYAYDAADHPITTVMPAVGGLSSEYVFTNYNSIGLPETMTNSSGQSYVYSAMYDDRGRPFLFGYGNSATPALGRFWGYDNNQRLSSQVASATGGGQVQNRSIGYDKAGNVTERNTDLNGAAFRECFKYDQRSRLTDAFTTAPVSNCQTGARGTGANPYNHAYTYSPDGNITTRTEGGSTITYTYPASGAASVRPHVPTAAGSNTYTWNNNGNLASRNVGTQNETFTWDAGHNLASIDATNPDGDSSFIYDADGQRLLRQTPQGKTLYIDGHEITAPTSGPSSAVRSYAFGATPVATRNPAGLDYLVTDNQGSVEETIPAGASTPDIVRTYLPYGKARTGSQPDTDHTWIGQIEDDTTGLHYLNARYYDPTTGIFTAPDTVYDTARPKTINPYQYGLDNPTTNSDPTGDCVPVEETGKCIGPGGMNPDGTLRPDPRRPPGGLV